MIILGIALLLAGYLIPLHILWVLGVILLVVGVVLLLLGAVGGGRSVGGRRHWY